LPDKAIDIVDEAAARVRIRNTVFDTHTMELEKEIDNVKTLKKEAIMKEQYEEAAALREKENELNKLLSEGDQGKSKPEKVYVTEDDIADIVKMWTAIPVTRLKDGESLRLLTMEDEIKKRVIGQDEAIEAISRAIRRSRVGLQEKGRPMGSFFFAGSTGVGKTELAKALAEFLFGDESAIIRLDMSEYMESHSVSKMVGSYPGYVGYDEGGQLTDMVRRKPYSVVLFDEIEKAHYDVFNILLQVMEDGVLTDAQGRKVSFKNTILIMTTNVGADVLSSEYSMGFRHGKAIGNNAAAIQREYDSMKDKVARELKKKFRPEFLNRVDEFLYFRILNHDDVKQVALKFINGLSTRVVEKGFKLDISNNMIEHIADQGWDLANGARPVRRLVQRLIEDPLSEKLLASTLKEGDVIFVDWIEEETVISVNSFDVKKLKSKSRARSKKEQLEVADK
jgi:ATP-dependent Clp protease ATP-binding subunit ClpC